MRISKPEKQSTKESPSAQRAFREVVFAHTFEIIFHDIAITTYLINLYFLCAKSFIYLLRKLLLNLSTSAAYLPFSNTNGNVTDNDFGAKPFQFLFPKVIITRVERTDKRKQN